MRARRHCSSSWAKTVGGGTLADVVDVVDASLAVVPYPSSSPPPSLTSYSSYSSYSTDNEEVKIVLAKSSRFQLVEAGEPHDVLFTISNITNFLELPPERLVNSFPFEGEKYFDES